MRVPAPVDARSNDIALVGDGDGNGNDDDDDDDNDGDSNGDDGDGDITINLKPAMAMATTTTRTATATATATGMVGDGMLTAMMAMAGYGDVVAKTRTYLHRQLEFFLSDTSCWIQKNTRNSSTYIHRNEY